MKPFQVKGFFLNHRQSSSVSSKIRFAKNETSY